MGSYQFSYIEGPFGIVILWRKQRKKEILNENAKKVDIGFKIIIIIF